MTNPKNPKGSKYYLYNRQGRISFAMGDMGTSLIAIKTNGKNAESFSADHPKFDPQKADRNKDGKISSWERTVGNEVAKSMGAETFEAYKPSNDELERYALDYGLGGLYVKRTYFKGQKLEDMLNDLGIPLGMVKVELVKEKAIEQEKYQYLGVQTDYGSLGTGKKLVRDYIQALKNIGKLNAETFDADEVAYAVMWEDVRRDMKYPKEDDNEGLIYGIEYMDGEMVSDVEWFATAKERDAELKSYIEEFGEYGAESFSADTISVKGEAFYPSNGLPFKGAGYTLYVLGECCVRAHQNSRNYHFCPTCGLSQQLARKMINEDIIFLNDKLMGYSAESFSADDQTRHYKNLGIGAALVAGVVYLFKR